MDSKAPRRSSSRAAFPDRRTDSQSLKCDLAFTQSLARDPFTRPLSPVLALLPMTQVSTHSRHFLSDKVEHFTESVIREMTRQAMQYDAVNLAQGFPDFSAPAEIKRAAQEAIAADVNQYAITWGAKSLRGAIARQMREWQRSMSIQKRKWSCAAARPRL